MLQSENRTEMIENLQKLLDQLCSPDLTIGESSALRSRLLDLLAAGDASRSEPAVKPSGISESIWQLALNRTPSLCAASF